MNIINKFRIGIVCSLVIGISSCKYLDFVPDNVATIDYAFANRMEAEKYLYTCYSYMPDHNTSFGNIGLTGADETWTFHPQAPDGDNANAFQALEIAKGNQNTNDPYMNFWSGEKGGKALYKAIRDCNIFLENVSDGRKVHDLEPYMRTRWVAEVRFLKAYYHFYLFRMYGPIVILDKNVPVSADPEALQGKRSPVDEVVKYISDLLDAAVPELPDGIANRVTELGRITRAAALSLKAKLWVTAASPLFNGNPDYAAFTDKDGVSLFNSAFDPKKWETAAAACKQAIDRCHANGNELYKFLTFLKLSDTTKTQMSIRNSVCEKWNSEIIWGLSKMVTGLQVDCMTRLDPAYAGNLFAGKEILNPTLNITHLFYSAHGVPIEEDKTWKYTERFSLRTATADDRFNITEGYETAALNFEREPRYYADLAFDGAVWYMQNSPSKTDKKTWEVKAKKGQAQARVSQHSYSSTGLWIKKLVSWKYVITQTAAVFDPYVWPEIRLADLYLLYAEALNETGNGAEAIVWIDKVRERAGLKGVEESWRTYSTNPGKFSSTDGLRKIIHQERTVELMFEGSRFWDLRRWKRADEALSQGTFGWDIEQESAKGYYQPRLLYYQKFIAPRDYLFPLKQYDLIVNPKLVQNPGW